MFATAALATSAIAIVGCGSSDAAPADASVPDASDASNADASNADAPSDGCADDAGARSLVDPSTAPELAIALHGGAPAMGVFDPSLASDGNATYMSYSVVPSQVAISTRMAVSNDRGATFVDLAPVNASVDIPCDAGPCPRIIFEVSSLVVDPTDAPARFKVFSHAYAVFPPDTTPHYEIGFIALQAANAPGGPYTTPKPAFDAAALRAASPALSDCDVFTEPGALVRGSAIDLALGCVNAATRNIRIVLLRSPDHGATFTYVSELVSAQDALAFGNRAQLDAANLFIAGGREYLVASPTTKVTTPRSSFDGYGGCLVFAMDDPDHVARDCAGTPRVVRSIVAPPGQFIGACTFLEGATGAGYLVPEAVFTDARVFRIYRPGIAGP